jgi:hypothetical protein
MGATYTRQSSSAIVDGGIIEAADINAEFNQILAAFAVSSGHTHDGTAAEGGPITKLLGTAITIGDATAGTDIAITFDGESNDGVLTWMEDEDYFQFSDDLLVTTTEKLQFRDTAIYINSSADGQLDLVADTEIQIAATTVDINGAVALNGAITGATSLTVDDITINGSTISDSGSINIESGSSLTVDVDGGINLDAGSGGNGIKIKDDATEILQISNSSSDVTIETKVSDKDLFIKGNDGGSTVTALTFDMSDAGKATFGGNVIVTGDLTVSGDDITMGTNTAGNILVADGTNFNSIAATSLSEISTIANDDVFLAVDTSGGGLKKVARSTVVSGLATSSALSNVSEDTTPQLGGNLDLNGSDIVTTSNADLELAPNGTGHVTIKGNTNPGTIQFNCENNSHGQQLKPQPHSVGSSAVHTLPNVTGELMPGKIEGTNFTGSLLVGHTTSGTLNAAQHNTGVGITALDALTSGDQNTALGGAALTAVTTGNDNIGIGYNAGSGITGAPGNTIIGVNAFVGSATDSNSGYNTVVGQNAMNVASGATFNTALGRDAGREVSTGDYNIFLGYNSGANDSTAGITTGSGNVIIGTVDPASRTGDRQLKIAGYDGSTTTTWISGDNNGVVTFADDIIIKDGGTIGSASDVDAMTISSGGVVTFSQNPVFPDGGVDLVDIDIDGGTDIGADLTTSDLIVVDDGAGGTNRKAALSRVVTLMTAQGFVTDDPTALAIALG